ncbi:LacI family DNA-binding transcriptional regulator [Zobellella sp. DQSA1]|uniref:LacI family DNA-binding transcriptional regulator n=1 Tax=Zobellella sp. DQSA1 TaxID=3342386 RepID=UPI0035BEBF0E
MTIELHKKTTLKEIAALAGVSLATVDRVLSQRARVSPHTRERVLTAIKELNEANGSPVAEPPPADLKSFHFGFVMESGAPFLNAIEKTVDTVRERFASRHISLDTKAMSRFDMDAFLALLRQSAREHDGLVLLCREDPAISACVNQIVREGTPVVCMTTDLCDTERLAYVGMNHVSAGRTAGHLMGRYLGNREGEVILVVSAPYRAQYERELGFRRVIREQFPNLRIRESLNNHDMDEESYENLMALFNAGIKPLGIYNVTGGTQGVARAIKEKGWTRDVVFIGHELNDSSYSLLSQNEVDVIIDQDLRAEVIDSVNQLLAYHGAGQDAPKPTPSAPIIMIRENL